MVQFLNMPRSAQSDDAPKRSPRKRATSPRASVDRVPRRTAPRKRVAPASREEVTAPRLESVAPVRSSERVVERRAPTPVAASKARSRAMQLQIAISVFIIVIGVGASAAVGVTDDGQIDVVQTIEERNERIRSGQGTEQEQGSIIVPVQNTTQRLPDGGLRGRGVGSAQPVAVPEPVSSTTASTTDDMASSTDATAESTEAGEAGDEPTPSDTEVTEDVPVATPPEETTVPIDDAGR